MPVNSSYKFITLVIYYIPLEKQYWNNSWVGPNKSTQPPLVDGLDNWNRPAKLWSYGRRLYKKHWIYKKNKLVFEFRLREWIVLFKERQVILEWSYLPLSQELFQHSRDNIIKYFADPSKSVYFNVNIDSPENIIKFAMMKYQSLNPKQQNRSIRK